MVHKLNIEEMRKLALKHYGKCLSIVTGVREVEYVRSKVYFDRKEGIHKPSFDSKTSGWEIDKKVNVCAECFENHEEDAAEVASQKTVNFFIKNSTNENYVIRSTPVEKQHTTDRNSSTNRPHYSNRDNRHRASN